MRPSKTQISLGIRPVRSESSLGAHVILLALSCGDSLLVTYWTQNSLNPKVIHAEIYVAYYSRYNCKWAGPWENVSYVICEQQRRRSACASAQSDQRLWCSLIGYYNISRFYIRNFKNLASFCGCAGRSETPEDTFCRVMAQMYLTIMYM